jgi:hypothetical protein
VAAKSPCSVEAAAGECGRRSQAEKQNHVSREQKPTSSSDCRRVYSVKQ